MHNNFAQRPVIASLQVSGHDIPDVELKTLKVALHSANHCSPT